MKAALLLALAGLATGLIGAEAQGPTAHVILKADQSGPVINKNLYGNFSEHLGRCVYEGLWVGPDSKIPNTRGLRNDVVAALREMQVPLLRWPGGCFADEYHWKDGIGPREKRPSMINTHWGGVVENNAFGTHEFFDLCEQIGAEPYISANVGSGTPQEMMEWVEYMNSDAISPMANLRRANGREKPFGLKYIGIGNESWGCGGSMRPEYYADEYRRYNTFAKNYGENRLYRIACGANVKDYNWTDKVMESAGTRMNAISLHYYTLPTGDWKKKGSATEFGEDQWFSTLRATLYMEELITRHLQVMDKHDKDHKVALAVDEWGTWYDVEPGSNPGFLYQQSTMRDAIVAGLNLHIFQAHADRVQIANIAQLINVLQSVILTDKERILLTPTYHVFRMYKVHQGATVVPVSLATSDYGFAGERIPAVSASASRDKAGRVHLSLVNCDPSRPVLLSTTIEGRAFKGVKGELLTAPAMQTHNTFDKPDAVKPLPFTGARLAGSSLSLELPAMSVVMLELE